MNREACGLAATRSTGQIEEGPVGYSVIAADAGIVSWRFKALQDAFPFVLIASPADYRLVRKKERLVSGQGTAVMPIPSGRGRRTG